MILVILIGVPHREASNTLIYGENKRIDVSCTNSCISHDRCTFNIGCKCEEINLAYCPDFCDRETGQCRGMHFIMAPSLFIMDHCLYLCSLLISLSIHFISDCNNFTKQTCLTTKKCKWVNNSTCTKCSSIDEQRDKFEECNPCLKYESDISCGDNTDGCEWCQGMYCTRNGKCEIKCELYATKKECSGVSVKCSWCLSTDSCIDNDAKCNDCSLYSEEFCPRGCDCSASTSNSLLVLIPIIAAGVVVIVVLAILCWFFVLRRRRAQGNDGIAMNSLTAKCNDDI